MKVSESVKNMRVLGIESSCDETGIAVYEAGFGLRAHCIYSQANMHSEYGGVVPELASRDHVRKILPLIQQTLCEANVDKKSLDGVAFTAGPGLVGALMVGASVARSFAWALGVPALGINHLEGHLLAPMFEKEPPDFTVSATFSNTTLNRLFCSWRVITSRERSNGSPASKSVAT